MMQHVATAKSEIAAFATAAETNSVADTGSNAQFGQLFKDQNAPNSVAAKSNSSQDQTPINNASQSSPEELRNDAISVENQDHTASNKSAENGTEKGSNAEKSASSQDKTTTESSHDINTEEQNTKSDQSDESNDVNPKETSQPAPSATQHDKKIAEESSKIVAEEWVLLIDNLKRLATNSRSPITAFEELGISTDDLELAGKVDKELLEKITENPFADAARMSLDGFKLAHLEDIKDPNRHGVITKKPVEQTIAKIVDKALSEVLSSAENEALPKEALTQETAKLLLQQPGVIREIASQLQASSPKSDISELGTPDTTLNNAIRKDTVVSGQQLENVANVDFTQKENIDLLKTLMVETGVDKNDTKVAIKMSEVDLNNAKTIVSNDELMEQEIQIASDATSKQSKVDKTDNVLANNDIKSILNLSSDKLDKVLENMAQRVLEGNSSGSTSSTERIAQHIVVPKTPEIINSIETSTKDFISALKSGLEEFKNQLSQGREPGIDLKALVAEALAQTQGPAVTTVANTTVSPEQIANSVSQVLILAQSMNRTIEERQDQMYSATLRDVAQVQGEQAKQLQLGQVESKFEKAINIAKPEGHQQLAEKVRWMVNTKNLVAEIRLDPAELGSVHVKVAMSGESATVNFVVQSQQARDAVDTATPRLKEMLAEKGIELGQSTVREESEGQQSQGELAEQGGRGDDETDNQEIPDQVLAQQNIVNGALGGIDYFV